MSPIDHRPLASPAVPRPMDVMRLPRNGSARFDAPLSLRVLDGTLWVTVDGQTDDLVLGPGATRYIEEGRVLAFALGDAARLAVRQDGTTPARAVWRTLQAGWERVRASLSLGPPTGRAPGLRDAGGRP